MEKSNGSEELLRRAYNLASEEQTHDLYREWAETYDDTMINGLSYATPRKTASLLTGALPDKTVRILDVGCGTGLAGAELASHGFRSIDGLDFSPEMLSVARKCTVGNVPVYSETITADLNSKLEIPSAFYDGMICTGTFTHAHVGPQCLDELFRVLKSGGLFACTVHKDIWEELGFEKKVRALVSNGVMRTQGMVMDVYFDTDSEPQGWYILWEKLK